MTPPQHLWFFTPASLRRLAGTLGLSVETCDHPWKVVPLCPFAKAYIEKHPEYTDMRK